MAKQIKGKHAERLQTADHISLPACKVNKDALDWIID
jgi:hypothetical protein